MIKQCIAATIFPLSLVFMSPAQAGGQATLTIDSQTFEFEVHGCQLPSGPNDPMATRLPRMAMIGDHPDGRKTRIDLRNQSGQRIDFSADGKMLYKTVWRQKGDDWSSDRGAEAGPLFRIEGDTVKADAHFQSSESKQWVEGSLVASCEKDG
jgi:hypothetical protein